MLRQIGHSFGAGAPVASIRSLFCHPLSRSFASTPELNNCSSSSLSGKLSLADGTVMTGRSFGASKPIAGEVVFNTGMVAYPEALTDPSYKGQILALTYPLIGNYGVPSTSTLDEFGLQKFFESNRIHAAGLIVSDYCARPSHADSAQTLSQWLRASGVPALEGVDTRALTQQLRVAGSMSGKIELDSGPTVPFEDVHQRNLVAEVSSNDIQYFGSGSKRILAVDCGMKYNLIRSLARDPDVELKVVPWNYDFSQEEFDGLFMSNGPGNPEKLSTTVDNLRAVLQRDQPAPVFGVCMGNQMLARAAGAKTYKMKFGNRSHNQPVIDARDGRCYITSQNHGFAVDAETLPEDWAETFRNANDGTNEGIGHRFKPFSSVQFHPEACGGPTDTAFLFDDFLQNVHSERPKSFVMPPAIVDDVAAVSAPTPAPRKVILLGSGGLSIGQAGEFDYSGSQAIKALKEEGVEVVLVNPNIATVQSSSDMADTTYFEPVTTEFVSKVIAKERPDAIMLQFGGQTALNCGVELEQSGVLAEHGVRVLGTSVDTIIASEDRKAFASKLDEIGEKVAQSGTATTMDEAVAVANKIGYPVLVRTAFALGGMNSGFADNEPEMLEIVRKAFSGSAQVILDKSFVGWKEIEYEVVRDAADNCVTVCNMENFDPLGIHTGDSVVVAPSQTLNNEEYFALRAASIKVVRHLGVIGECNVQFALNPKSLEYFIIEVNPRLSRSSALASKATGYPLAYVAAKLALGKTLLELQNAVTKKTTACFEPSLDYVVVKMPRWDNSKFASVSRELGPAMKSVGEVMGIGRKFEEAFQKAVRMVDDSLDGFGDLPPKLHLPTNEAIDRALIRPNDQRVFSIARAMQSGYSVDRIHDLTKIDKFFLEKLSNIHKTEEHLKEMPLSKIPTETLRHAKQIGFSDRQIARCTDADSFEVRETRKSAGIVPFVKQIDTLAAEFPAETNYLYCTYNGSKHDVEFDEHGTMVLGCGAYRIGSSCEFDWCAVSCLHALRDMRRPSVMVNYNPETVSTDFDECDRLYFEELSLERVLDIYEAEACSGVIVSVGGQIPNNLAVPLHRHGVRLLGTQPDSIDSAEDRNRFSSLLDRLGVDQPEWQALQTVDEAKEFADQVGYPVLVRPSYVLSGAAMNVASSPESLEAFLEKAVDVSRDCPIVISKYVENAHEIELDAVAKDGELLVHAISEHVENAGVHSGDASLVFPAQSLNQEVMRRVRQTGEKIARALKITGPFNIQFLSKENELKVIECNLRASRSFPFVSKTFNTNFIVTATRAIMGEKVPPRPINVSLADYVCIKMPMFSFNRLQGADPVLKCEMASTGEVACFGLNQYEAFMKSMMSTGFHLPTEARSVLLRTGPPDSKLQFLNSTRALRAQGFKLYATPGTHEFLERAGVENTLVHMPGEGPNALQALDLLKTGKISLVINIPRDLSGTEQTNGYALRRTAVDFRVPLITNLQLARMLVRALEVVDPVKMRVLSWNDYIKKAAVKTVSANGYDVTGSDGVLPEYVVPVKSTQRNSTVGL
eukprot:831426_1